MARNIKGITVQIGGDTTGLEKALKSVNTAVDKTQSALSDVTRLLKLDPSNTTLVAQQQKLLAQAVDQTKEKLEKLESVQDQLQEAFQSGDLGEDKYMAFQRELEATRGKLERYQNTLSDSQSEQENLAANTERLDKLFSAIGANVDDYADVLGSRLTNAIKHGTANAEQLQTAIKKIGSAATSGKADMQQLTDALDTIDDGQAIKNLIADFKTAEDAAQDLGEMIEGSVAMQAADQLSGVGDGLQNLGDSAADVFAQTENAVSKVHTYFDETGEAAEQSAAVVKNVFAAGFGDSIDSVADAVIEVKKQLGELDAAELTNITQQVIVLDELFGIDMNETLRGADALMQQYGMTAQEAMNYIVAGTQHGLDKTNELGDNLSEYSGKFEQAGYSAQEYFQLLQNGLAGGAYNLDKVNGAINEVTTRLADGTIGSQIDAYSAKTQNLFQAWQNGQATQKDVIDSIVADIKGCTGQQDALNLAAQAFGPMAEDGNLTFISSLTSVGDTYNDVGNAAQHMIDQANTPMQDMASNANKVKESLEPLGAKLVELANVILPILAAVLGAISGWFSSLPGPVQSFIVILGVLLGVFIALTPIIAALAGSFGLFQSMLLPIIAVIAAVAAAITIIITVIKNWGAITQWLGNLWRSICQGVANAGNAMKNAVVTGFTNIKNAAVEKWNAVKSAIVTPIEAAKTKVKSVVDAIKGFFANMKLKLPHINLPHFKVTGKLSINPPSVPHLSIDWYKAGGIMTKPTVFGLNGNTLMAGGEAGAEAILPLTDFYNKLDAVMSNRLDVTVMEQYLKIIAENSDKNLYLDDGTLVGKLMPLIDVGLQERADMDARFI